MNDDQQTAEMHDNRDPLDNAGPGTRLAQMRSQAGLSLDDVCEYLHLKRHIVEAIESNQYGSLGSHVFIRGYLRGYAQMMGAPIPEIMEAFNALGLEDKHTAPLPIASRSHAAVNRKRLFSRIMKSFSYVLFFAMFVLVGVWWYTHPMADVSPVDKIELTQPVTPEEPQGEIGTPIQTEQPALAPIGSDSLTPTPVVGAPMPVVEAPMPTSPALSTTPAPKALPSLGPMNKQMDPAAVAPAPQNTAVTPSVQPQATFPVIKSKAAGTRDTQVAPGANAPSTTSAVKSTTQDSPAAPATTTDINAVPAPTTQDNNRVMEPHSGSSAQVNQAASNTHTKKQKVQANVTSVEPSPGEWHEPRAKKLEPVQQRFSPF